MQILWKKIIGLFTKSLSFLDENNQMNLIQSFGKDNHGYATVDVKPVGSNQSYTLYPHQIMNKQYIKNQFLSADLKLVKAMLTAEGDIFVIAKEYQNNDEVYLLKSLLNGSQWKLTFQQLETQSAVLGRLNKRFLTQKLNSQINTCP